MEPLCGKEHQKCIYHTTKDEIPLIEKKEYPEGMEGTLHLKCNKVALVLEGTIWYALQGVPHYEATKGKIIFLPAGVELVFKVKEKSMAILLRVDQPIKLCDNYSMNKLYEYGCLLTTTNGHTPIAFKRTGVLDINFHMWSYANDLSNRMSSGLRCRRFHEMKIKEFLMMLHAYYSKEDLYGFFLTILSPDTAFSENIRLNWREYKTVSGLAGFMNLSIKQFTEKFKTVFNKTPYRWMVEEKAKEILEELMTTDKSIKEVSIENGFNTMAQFSNFCKTELGEYPSDIRKNRMKIISE